ncbi:hypothetical protein [Azomonas macrocytogenes]|uniref:Uncharacterized protein n=1 Tax=Azomonas macrocytogenes TaxID=69962 RepID=A0A839T6Y3_AZOMA|nr:hypothetical protein [Azomonas macrocytogenes]MBB3105267.1 hypothetical protein [Azomonas macrocytogenes]
MDKQGHAAFCLEAIQGGLIGEDALGWLESYPNAYGLYRLTGEVVAALESRLTLPRQRLFRQKRKLLQHLNAPFFDAQVAASATVQCIEAGLFPVDNVAPLIERGPDCAHELIQTVSKALGAMLVAPEWASDCLAYGLQGELFFLESQRFKDFDLTLPEVMSDDFREINVLLFKTLDAMSHFFVPFHTPATFIGEYSYLNYEIADAYHALAERVKISTHPELVDYLLDTPSHELATDTWAFTEGDKFDEDSAYRVAALLIEMHQLVEHTGFQLLRYDKAELQTVLLQAEQANGQGGPYTGVLSALVDALRTFLQRVEHHTPINAQDFAGTPNDGLSFFESICVNIAGDFHALYQSAFEGFDSIINGTGYPAIGLPIAGPQMTSQTLPILQRTAECIAHLTNITTALNALEETQHAQP